MTIEVQENRQPKIIEVTELWICFRIAIHFY